MLYPSLLTRDQLVFSVKQAALLTGDFTLRSGKKSKYYLDKYLIGTKPELLAPVGTALGRLVQVDMVEWAIAHDRHQHGYGVDKDLMIAAPELGAVPLATAASLAIGMPFLIVRKDSKGYGTGKQVEGKFVPETTSVTIIEDVVTTGGAVIAAAKALEVVGVHVWKVVCVLDRQQGGREAIEKAGYKFYSLLTWEDLSLPPE